MSILLQDFVAHFINNILKIVKTFLSIPHVLNTYFILNTHFSINKCINLLFRFPLSLPVVEATFPALFLTHCSPYSFTSSSFCFCNFNRFILYTCPSSSNAQYRKIQFTRCYPMHGNTQSLQYATPSLRTELNEFQFHFNQRKLMTQLNYNYSPIKFVH